MVPSCKTLTLKPMTLASRIARRPKIADSGVENALPGSRGYGVRDQCLIERIVT